MNVKNITYDSYDFDVITYDSLEEFYDYIINTPINKVFRWETLKSVEGTESFTGTNSFEEANDLFRNGYKEGAKTLTNMLKVEEQKSAYVQKRKTTYGVVGYQPCVPLYLNGIPNNMITTKIVSVKQKIVVINKDVSYSAFYDKSEIQQESIKAFRIIRKLESQGYRCELNIVLGTHKFARGFACKVKLKGPDERLNISKMAFPLVHPSMLRRLFFRFIETYPDITEPFTHGYGVPISNSMLSNLFEGVILPRKINIDVENIKDISDLKNL